MFVTGNFLRIFTSMHTPCKILGISHDDLTVSGVNGFWISKLCLLLNVVYEWPLVIGKSKDELLLRLTYNTRFKPGNQCTIYPNCNFIKILEVRPSVLSYDSKYNCLTAKVTVQNQSLDNSVYCLQEGCRFGSVYMYNAK